MDEKSSEKAHAYLKKLGVHIWTKTFVEGYENDVVFTNGTNFQTETLIWAAGVKGNPPSGIEANALGKGNRIITDAYCRLNGNEDVYILGDAALRSIWLKYSIVCPVRKRLSHSFTTIRGPWQLLVKIWQSLN